MMQTDYKYIRFEKEEGTGRWWCFNRRTDDTLASVFYYPRWKQWVDEREEGVIFNNSCHIDMAHFLTQLNKNKDIPKGKAVNEMKKRNGQRIYGDWAGNEEGRPEDKTRCIEEVWPAGRSIIPYQCRRKRGHGPDGLYCKQHAKIKGGK